MRQCIFSSCKSRPDDRIGNIALVHRFPKEEHIRKLWVQWVKEKCGLPDFEFNYKAGLCYRHFERQCYHRSNGLLKPFSYPTFSPQDLDNISIIGSSSREISINGVPKTNLIIKVDPTLLKKGSSPEKSNPGKKFVLLVTDKGIQSSEASKSNLSIVTSTQKQPEAGLVRPQDVPPLRFIGRERPARVAQLATTYEDMSSPIKQSTICLLEPELSRGVGLPHSLNLIPVQKNVNFSQSAFSSWCTGEQQSTADCLPHKKSLTGASKSRTLNLLQTVLDSSRKRLRGYRRRLQLERRRMTRLEKLLEEMKEEKIISAVAAGKIESILYEE